MPEARDEAPAPLPDTERIVQRAIDSVLDKTGPIAFAPAGPEEAKVQPWAETAAPAGKNKRPLEALLADFATRIAATPDAVAAAPAEKRPAESFFERLTKRDGGGRPARGRRRRPRSSRSEARPPSPPPAPRPPQTERPPGAGGASRRRRGRRRRR